MLTPLALAALTLAPAHHQAGLQLTNVRLTVGELGPVRPNSRYLPGDIVYVGYDIEGLSIEADGTTKYTILMEIADAAGKPIFKQAPKEFTELVPLRGNKIPAKAFITLGLDMEPGMYTCKVTVTDSKTNASNNLTQKFEVLKKDFGIVAVMTTYDFRSEIPAPTTGTVGQTIVVWMTIASFQRDPKTKQPNVVIELNFVDEQGKPTLGQPIKRIQDSGIDQDRGAFPIYFPLYLNRPGKFTLKVTATDKVANKTATYELPFTVLPPA